MAAYYSKTKTRGVTGTAKGTPQQALAFFRQLFVTKPWRAPHRGVTGTAKGTPQQALAFFRQLFVTKPWRAPY